MTKQRNNKKNKESKKKDKIMHTQRYKHLCL